MSPISEAGFWTPWRKPKIDPVVVEQTEQRRLKLVPIIRQRCQPYPQAKLHKDAKLECSLNVFAEFCRADGLALASNISMADLKRLVAHVMMPLELTDDWKTPSSHQPLTAPVAVSPATLRSFKMDQAFLFNRMSERNYDLAVPDMQSPTALQISMAYDKVRRPDDAPMTFRPTDQTGFVIVQEPADVRQWWKMFFVKIERSTLLTKLLADTYALATVSPEAGLAIAQLTDEIEHAAATYIATVSAMAGRTGQPFTVEEHHAKGAVLQIVSRAPVIVGQREAWLVALARCQLTTREG